MKQAILLFVCMGTMLCSFAQETASETPKPSLTKEEYLKKSKRQRTGAIVMISAGGALVIAGIAVAANDLGNDLYNIFDDNASTNNHETLSTVLAVVGVAAMLGSIGLFVSAHKNKKKAMSISFKNETAPLMQNSMVFQQYVPSLSLRIRL
jgi:hypothetical protein